MMYKVLLGIVGVMILILKVEFNLLRDLVGVRLDR